ncbi:MAG: sortase [Eubacterium sp.]|nr:sortase [Eubacterium sp.]
MKIKKRFGKVLLAIGIVLISISVIMVIKYELQDMKSGKIIKDVLHKIEEYDAQDHDDSMLYRINDTKYIGVLNIPSLGVVLPICSEWNSENSEKGVCRYLGNIDERNLILAGHNYRSMLRSLSEIETGSEIIITDINQAEHHYTVTYTEVVGGYNSKAMISGEWDMTVFTCTIPGNTRYVVRCVLNERVKT